MKQKSKEQIQKELKKTNQKILRLENESEQLKKIIHNIHNKRYEYGEILKKLPDIVYKIDTNGYFTFVNDFVKWLGYNPEELLGKHFSIIIHPDDIDEVMRFKVLPKYKGKITGDEEAPKLFDERRTGKRKTIDLEARLLKKNGIETKGIISVLSVVTSMGYYDRDVHEKEEKFLGTIGIIRDISKQKEAEESLNQYKQIVENVDDALFIKDLESRYILVNKKILEMFGNIPEEKIIGKNDKELMPLEDAMVNINDDQEVFKTGSIKKHVKKNNISGKDYWFSATKIPLKDKNGKIIGLIGVARDITELISAKNDLIAERERLIVTLRSIGEGVISVDKKGKIILINKITEKLFGINQEEAIGKSYNKVFNILDEKARRKWKSFFNKILKSGKAVRIFEHTIPAGREGKERILSVNCAPIFNKDRQIIGVVAVLSDITEEKKMEENLIKAQKIESLGILAGGIAHDFNNFLTGILGNISVAKASVDLKKEIFNVLTDAENASISARNLTKQLLTFSKGGTPIKKKVAISELLKSTVYFALSGSNLKCKYHIPANLELTDLDESQIFQVINNLIINAEQSMPEGGEINISAENIILKSDNDFFLKPGKYVKITIQDYGIGISKEHLLKIFDPYFTTKQKGSGLGLAVCYSIIKRHNGHIIVESELGKGATFDIYLPASKKKKLKIEAKKDRPLKPKGKILIMDDEIFVQRAASRLLKYNGYKVECVINGQQAIKLYKRARELNEPFALVIMDLTIPGGMGGEKAIKRLLEIDPKAKVIVSSGYSDSPIMANYKEYGFKGVVHKPYTLDELSDVLNKVLVPYK